MISKRNGTVVVTFDRPSDKVAGSLGRKAASGPSLALGNGPDSFLFSRKPCHWPSHTAAYLPAFGDHSPRILKVLSPSGDSGDPQASRAWEGVVPQWNLWGFYSPFG